MDHPKCAVGLLWAAEWKNTRVTFWAFQRRGGLGAVQGSGPGKEVSGERRSSQGGLRTSLL